MDGRVEAAGGALAGGHGELGELEQFGPDAQLAGTVQPGELRVGLEAREQRLQPPELVLRLEERRVVAVCFEQELDLGAHGPEVVAEHQEVRVVVSGGSVTTRTAGAAGLAWRRATSRRTRAASSRRRCS